MGVRKYKRGRYIKGVAYIPENEFQEIGVFQSMMGRFSEHITPYQCRDSSMRMVVADEKGGTKTMEVDGIVCREKDFTDAFSDGRTFCGVKLFWSDGTWEYGFKMWQNVDRVYRRNCKLYPLYTIIGSIDDKTGELVEPKLKDTKMPAWVMELIPRYNERIKDGLWANDPSIETSTTSLADWKVVSDVICTNYMNTAAKWMHVDTGAFEGTLPICVGLGAANKSQSSKKCRWKEEICKKTFGCLPSILDMSGVKVSAYSYLKSIYCNNSKRVKEYKVFPISDVLMLVRRKWDSSTRDYVSTEVWNNLDETCKGNV